MEGEEDGVRVTRGNESGCRVRSGYCWLWRVATSDRVGVHLLISQDGSLHRDEQARERFTVQVALSHLRSCQIEDNHANWWEYAKFSIQTMCRMKKITQKVEVKYATVTPSCHVDNVTDGTKTKRVI